MILGPPGAPSDCDVHNHTNTELGVTCATPGFDGGDARGHTFHLEVRFNQLYILGIFALKKQMNKVDILKAYFYLSPHINLQSIYPFQGARQGERQGAPEPVQPHARVHGQVSCAGETCHHGI